MKHPHNRPTHRRALVASAITIALSTSLYAAENEAANDAEVVEITGSRLKGVDMEGASPVVTVDRETIEQRGYTSIADFLADLPQTATAGTFSSAGQNASGIGAPAGAAGASLRGLGTDSTLVLINGRRVAINSFANGTESFVDIDAIPMSAVDRVELLLDGSSSVYGSDAVAGVINFIMKKDYQGQEVSVAYSSDLKDSNYNTRNVSFLAGFGNDRSNTTISLDYFSRDKLLNSDRDVNVTFWGDGFYWGEYPDGDDWSAYSDDMPELGCDTIETPTAYGAGCRFDYVGYRAIQGDKDQLGLMVNHTTQLGGGNEIFVELMYQNKEGHAYNSPARLRLVVGYDNLPQEVIDSIGALEGDRVQLRTYAPERRVIGYESDSTRVLFGLRGEIGDWSYETALNYGENNSTDRTEEGYFSSSATTAAIANGSYNPFYFGRQNEASVIKSLRGDGVREGESTAKGADFRLNGNFGNVVTALGLEYRKEDVSDSANDVLNNGDLFGTGVTSAFGSRSQKAAYGEFLLPVGRLDLIGALRYDSYSDFGSATNPKVAFRFKATDDLILRGSWSTAFRAPSIVQISAGETVAEDYISCNANDPFYSFCGEEGRGRAELTYDSIYQGNKELKAEESESINVGLSWNVSNDLQLTMDYWKYDFENVVVIGSDYTLDRCLNGDLPTVEDGADLNGGLGCVVSGDPLDPNDRQLVELYTGVLNVAGERTDGVDVNVKWLFADTGVGKFKLDVLATRTLSYERQNTSGLSYESYLGSLETASEIGRPELVWDAKLSWSNGNWFAALGANYTASINDGDFAKQAGADEIRGTTDDTPWQRTIASWLVWDVSVGYDISDKATVKLAARNVTDEEPPFAASPTKGYASSVHDFFGRIVSLRYTQSF